METATPIGTLIGGLALSPKPSFTSKTPSVDPPAPEPPRPLSALYAERLARAGHPIGSWGSDQAAIRAAWREMEAHPGRGLIVGGRFGRGKTTLVHDMLGWPRCPSVKVVHTSSPAEMKTLDTDECPEEHLFIDDIWSDSTRTDYGTARDFVGEYLRWWLDKHSWYKWTKRLFLTTNGTLKDLNKRYGVRLVSRIMDCCEPVTLKDRNWRTICGGREAWQAFGQ